MTGHVWWSVLGGGWIHGPVDAQTGKVTGDELMYIYPDMEHVLYGTFRRGAMLRAEPTTVADIGKSAILASDWSFLVILSSHWSELTRVVMRAIFIALVLLALKIT